MTNAQEAAQSLPRRKPLPAQQDYQGSLEVLEQLVRETIPTAVTNQMYRFVRETYKVKGGVLKAGVHVGVGGEVGVGFGIRRDSLGRRRVAICGTVSCIAPSSPRGFANIGILRGQNGHG